MKHRILSAVLAGCLILTLIPFFAEAESEVRIETADDLLLLAKNCTLDTWSKGKTVQLMRDIDLSHCAFIPIPVFCGTFDGNGHTISGIHYTKDGSNVGLFRYVETNGTVRSLSVEAEMTPGGTKSIVGGIVGKNMGTVQDCEFHGTVKGDSVVGGIVGKNAAGGRIERCTAEGTVNGEVSTGGVVGKNEGTVQSCCNRAEVNTVYEEKKNDWTHIDIDTGAIWETVQTMEEEKEEKSLLGDTDTGGIAGNSTGIVQGCINEADIGYPHFGYNVGGIVGRQSGYLLGCKNRGCVRGRKDVGGIVGQMEPYLILNASEDHLKNLHLYLNDLYTVANRLAGDSDGLREDADTHLTEISRYSKTARDTTQNMLDRGADFVDDSLEEVNVHTAVLSQMLDRLEPIFTDLENASDDLALALGDVSEALSSIDLYAPDLGEETENMTEALSSVSDALRSMKRAAHEAKLAVRKLQQGISVEDTKESREALSDFEKAIKNTVAAKQNIKTAIADIRKVLETKPESFEAIGVDVKTLTEDLKTIETSLQNGAANLAAIDADISTLVKNTTVDFGSLRDAADDVEWSLELLEKSMDEIVNTADEIASVIEDSAEKLNAYSDDVTGQLNTAGEKLSAGSDQLSYATHNIDDAIAALKGVVSDLSDENPLSFTVLGGDLQQQNDDLFGALSGISGEIYKLRTSVSGYGDQMSGDLRQLNDRFRQVMDLILDELEQLSSEPTGLSDLFLDASDSDIKNTRQGKVAECENFGKVEADRNIGGIAGSLAIEYTIDPEDEIEKPSTLRFTYQTKAILEGCINNGEVLGKKDCVGGVAGLSELGTLYECENYGGVQTTDGNYAGGIIGKSESNVRRCYAKSHVEGKRYAGGIAGKGSRLSDCYAIPSVRGSEALGAICGMAAEGDGIAFNYFVDSERGGIDSVSYHGKAEPISFDSLKAIPSVPARMTGFTVTFTAGERTVAVEPMDYGESTARIKYPEVPEKAGEFGHWNAPSEKTVTRDLVIDCDYQKYITSLASVETDGKLSLALAEGSFTDEAVFHVTPGKRHPYEKAGADSKVYDLLLQGTDLKATDPVSVRVLNPKKDDVRVWVWSENGWKETAVTANGKYVLLTVSGPNSTVCLEYIPKGQHILLSVFALLFVLGGAGGVIWLHKTRKGKKLDDETSDQSDEASER